LSNSLDQHFPLEANSSSGSQGISLILWNQEFHYHIHKCLPLVPVLSQINPVHAFLFFYLEAMLFSFSVSIDLTSFLQSNCEPYSEFFCVSSAVDVTFLAQTLCCAVPMETYQIFWLLWSFFAMCPAPWGKEVCCVYWMLGYTCLPGIMMSPVQLPKRQLCLVIWHEKKTRQWAEVCAAQQVWLSVFIITPDG
jgi:hypothetical protein